MGAAVAPIFFLSARPIMTFLTCEILGRTKSIKPLQLFALTRQNRRTNALVDWELPGAKSSFPPVGSGVGSSHAAFWAVRAAHCSRGLALHCVCAAGHHVLKRGIGLTSLNDVQRQIPRLSRRGDTVAELLDLAMPCRVVHDFSDTAVSRSAHVTFITW